eukprot:scaffold19113_cov98-Isochrysis_galbana.AAC.1
MPRRMAYGDRDPVVMSSSGWREMSGDRASAGVDIGEEEPMSRMPSKPGSEMDPLYTAVPNNVTSMPT